MRRTFRRMNKYHPRRSSKVLKKSKKELSELESQIQQDVAALLLIIQNGSPEQIETLSEQTRADLVKYGPTMEKIAQEIGAPYPKAVHSFLDSIDKVLDAQKNNTPSPYYSWIDDNKIQRCKQASERLDKVLKK